MSERIETSAPDATAGAEGSKTAGGPSDGDAPTPHQKKAYGGSYSADDPDRPQWERDTKLEREYEYHHADGTYAYSKLKGRRSDGEKAFLTGIRLQGDDLIFARRERPHDLYKLRGLTSFERGTGEEPNLLYRLHNLVAAMDARPADRVFITEGEKDADTLWALNLIATTNPNGALSWKDEFNSQFEGRDVVILVDNDAKGRQRRDRLLASLVRVAGSVRAVELPGLPENGDVTLWLAGGKTKADLLQVVDATEPYRDFGRDAEGRPFRTLANARLAIARLGASVRFDEFALRYEVTGLAGFGPLLDDPALTRMRLLAEERWSLAFAKERWTDIVTDDARRNTYHPVRDYLDSLQWDGSTRLDTWLVSYAGAEDTEYVRAVGAIVLTAAVRRVRQPGCKFDEMLVLESEQGTNKSSALAVLAIREEWFTDDLPLDADSKVLMERTAGRWLCEVAEMKGLRRSEIEHVKSMLSRQVDKARLAYGRMTTEQPRQCVFIGTTNDTAYLRDMTGNRRFWPVKVSGFDLRALRRDRDQLWAEAAAREKNGASIRLPEHLWAEAGEQQAHREIGDPFFEILSERLDGQEGKVRACDIWEAVELGQIGQRTQDHNVRLSAVMQKLGWRRPKGKLRFDGQPQLAWVKGKEGTVVSAFVEVPRSVVLGTARPM